tara:strand:- start:3 stop:857 length:855 start_codon:yes stop_codon:yes gene_type:complete
MSDKVEYDVFEKSRSLSVTSESRELRRNFIVKQVLPTDGSTPAYPVDFTGIFNATGMAYNEELPDEPGLFLTTYNVTSSDEGTFQWDVEGCYKPDQVINDGGGETGGQFDQINSDIEVLFLDTWRVGPFDNEDPASTDGSITDSDDIGGSSVDVAGEPITRFVTTQTTEITRRFSSFPSFDVTVARFLAGRRNSQPYLGCPSGTLLFEGANLSREGSNTYTMRYRFTYDPIRHQRQVPKRHANGDVVTEEVGVGVEKSTVAKTVIWRQPFPQTAIFSVLGVDPV